MTPALRLPIVAVLIAIAVNAAMDAVGLAGVSFASLLPLTLLFWAIQRLPAKALGLALGHWRHYALALAYPVGVIGVLAGIAALAGVVDLTAVAWRPAAGAFLGALAMTLPLALLTEEGFFRGWLFAALRRAGLPEMRTAIWTSIAFALWHLPAVLMDTEDALPAAQVPVLLANAVVIGTLWGALRARSGSILVTSVSHAVWNAGVYVLFGYGATVGVLGIEQTAIYGPESGVLGLGINLAIAGVVWRRLQARQRAQAASDQTTVPELATAG